VLRLSDERNFARTMAGMSLIVAPLLLLLATLISPDLSGDPAERLAEISDNEARYVVSGYLFLLAAWAFVPGLIGLWRLFRGPRVTVGQLGAGLVLIGVITTISFFGFGAYEYEAAQPDLDPGQMAQLADNVDGSGVTTPLFIVTFVVGIGIGSLIVAWSLWRRRVVPPWAPAAIVAGTILGAFSEDSVALGAIGFASLLVGFGWVGLKLLSMSDEEWDLLGRAPGPAAPPPGPAA
jgi:MFS family permease